MPYTIFFSKDGKAIHAATCCVAIQSFLKAIAPEESAWMGSHGCVRLSEDDARILFEWAEEGIPLTIKEK